MPATTRLSLGSCWPTSAANGKPASPQVTYTRSLESAAPDTTAAKVGLATAGTDAHHKPRPIGLSVDESRLQEPLIVGLLDGGQRGMEMLDSQCHGTFDIVIAIKLYEPSVFRIRLGRALCARSQREADIR